MDESKLEFVCPKCGKISQDLVIFLCNHCKDKDLIMVEGTYMCPACLVPGDNFECFNCGSKEVKLVSKIPPVQKKTS